MLTEQCVMTTRAVGVELRGTYGPAVIRRLAALVRSVACATVNFVLIPIRPEAELWEASLWSSRTLPDQERCFESDPFASKRLFVRDRWPLA